MKRQILIGLVALLATSTLLSAEQPAYKPGVVFVRFANDGAQPPNTATKNSILNSVLQSSGTPVKQEYALVSGLTKVAIPAGMSVENAVATLKQSSSVLYAEPVYIYQLCAVPNDTWFSELWGMRNIGQTGGTPGADISATSAWDISTGSNNIIVAVTDTGVDYNHPDLNANMWRNPGEIPGNGIDDDGDGFIDDVYGCDTGDMDGDPMDDSPVAGHGTHVSGTIGAVGNNNTGVTGVCWNVKIMAVKIADSNGFLTGPIPGIDYAVSHGAKVINASWGGGPYSQALYDSILAAQNAGVIFVAAAGNASSNNDLIPFYPAGYNLPNIISVMATNDTDSRSYYSNYGLTSVDLAAPGGGGYGDSGDILSTYPGGGYALMAGTSMASPHVAGACALLLSVKPTLSYTDVKELLLNTTDPVLPGLCVSGGRMNLAAAVKEVVTDSTPPSAVTWDIEPKATGFHTVSMRAQISTDISGVEYYFECVNNVTINSGWEPNTLYTFTNLSPSTTYGFHFKVRDKSPQQNQTGWSETKSTTTAPANNDNLSPAADPARWAIKPRIYRLTPPAIRMKAFGVDESGVQFRFKYWDNADPVHWNYSGGWQDSDTWIFTSGIMDHTYSFQCAVRDKSASHNATGFSTPPVSVGLRTGPRILPVPSQYGTIQEAIDAAADGDIVEVSPFIYTGIGNRNITFDGKAITVRSIDPENPDIVAQTIINCQGSTNFGEDQRRAFIFENFEGADSILAGFTIINGEYKGDQGIDGVPGGNLNGRMGGSGVGGAIACFASSPTIRNCVIQDSNAEGGNGGNGANGDDYAPGVPGVPDPNDPNIIGPATPPVMPTDGGNGGHSGVGYGGGIYCDSASGPLIQNCIIGNCRALAGNAGNGGNGGNGSATPDPVTHFPVPGGDGGDGGSVNLVAGGGIYCATSEALPATRIIGCSITGCDANNSGQPGQGGAGGTPGGNPGLPGNYNTALGGGIYYGLDSSPLNISSTTLSQNETYSLYFNAPGGGIFVDSYGPAPATFSDCNFIANYASGDGGGIFYWGFDNAQLILRNCDLTSNISARNAGGLRVLSGGSEIIDVYDSNFIGNISFFGGGIYLDETVLNLQNSNLQNNRAVEGGAIEAVDSTLTINNARITNNMASTPAGLGGGLALWNSPGTITDSSLSGNTAENFGGAAFITGWTTSPMHFINSLISDNTAYAEGGGLSCNVSGWAKLDNCTVADNTVINDASGTGGGVISTEYYAWVEINNSILWGNSAANGPQIAIGSSLGPYCDDTDQAKADVDVNYSDVEGGESNVFVMDPTYDCTALWWLAGNIDADPLFADTTINEPAYYLSQVAAGQLVQSPCVDKGSADANSPDIDLADYTTRTDGVTDAGIVDMGYHYQVHPYGVNPTLQYSLVILVTNDVGGRLFAQGGGDDPFTIEAPNSRIVKAGTVVSLQALADAGYSILSWTGTDNDAITGQNNTVTMNSNKVVTVTFNQYRLTIEVLKPGAFNPDGYLVATGDSVDPFTLTARNEPNSRGVTPGEVVQLEAFPDANFRVMSWQGSDNDASTALTNTVTMDSDKTVVVSFEPIGLYYLTVSVAGGQGTVDPNGRSLRTAGEVVTLTATPSNPSDVIIWSGTDDDYSHLTTNKVTMDGHKDVTVRFYSPRILYVGADGDFLTIQQGINEATDGDIVMVLPGTYNIYESSEDSPFLYIYSKAITLTSVDPTHPEDTVILGGFVIFDVGRDTVIDGFTIQANYGAGDGCPGQNTNCGNPLNDGMNGGSIAGGGMELYDDTSPTVRNCVFQNCSIQAGSGGAGANGGDGGWGGFAHGGAVSVGPDSNPLFENCIFSGNRAYGGDGGNGSASPPGHGGSWSWSGIIWDWAPPGGYLDYWRYSGYGGAVYCDTNSTPDFNNCTFANNIAYGGSCGISGVPPGSAWPHSHYQIDRYGGAVYCAADSKPVFANSIFSGNQADTNGLRWHWNRTDAADSAIAYENLSYGGAIAFEDSAAPSFINCIISGNTAHIGGGAWSDDAYPDFVDSQFVSNVANDGAGMLAVDGQATILRTDFIANTANISGSEGGAIGLFGTNADIIDSNITRNTSLGYGGGIYISGKYIDGDMLDGNSTVFVKNCLIINNRATQGGAGISAAWHSDPNIVNCTITGNVSSAGPGGGLYASYSNYTTIVNSIIWGNSAFTGNEIAVGVPISPSRVDVSYSDIRQTTGSLNVQAGSVLNLNDGVINANPLFTGVGDYYLSQTAAGQPFDSPCVDTGIGDVNDPRIELGGYTTRTDNAPDENPVDMGYHHQPVIYSEELFHLTISIVGPGSVSVHPVSDDGNYPGGTIVTMTADPCSGYRVRKWTNTDNDNSASLTNTVTMWENKNVSVEFGVPAMLTVPGDYTTIQAAVSTAKAGDIISIASGVYDTPNLEIDKDITLTSSNPDDPCVVAATVISGAGQACIGVIFTNNTSDQTVLNGITIANCGYGFPTPDDPTIAGQNGVNGGNGDGAGIYIMTGASPSIKNCIIRNCNVNGGNASNGGNADATTNAGRGGWGGWAHGAGIYIAPLANPTIINTTITNNTVVGGNGGNGGNFADNGGDAGVGGNWSDGVSWEVWGYIGDYRFYSGYGAGVYCDRNSSATFIACNITNNTARGGVSGIGGNRDTGIQIPPPDTSYEIPAYGGGVYCAADSMVTFTDCNITGNTAVKPDVAYHVDPYLGHGGGVAFENTALISFVNCNISDNNSSVGGGIYWSGGTPEVIDCNIIGNDAYIGGGIFGTHSEGHISNCTIRNNFAGVLPTDVDVIIGEGGGLYASSMGALIEDCLFTENTTDASGGGIYAYGTSDVATTIKNCLMVDNEAGRDGGAISANWESVVDVLNCTIYNNRATGAFGLPGTNGFGGGLYCSYGADTDIKNSIFWDNNGTFGTQVAVESGFEFVQICGTVSVSYSDIDGGEDDIRTGNCSSGLIWGPGNIDANPLFINTSEGNFHLQQQAAGQNQTSPCVDAGSDFSSRFGLHKYTTRTDRAPDILIVDMGYHYFRPEESCIKVYYSSDGIVNFDDLAYIALSWLNKECTEADGWCQGRDVTYDGAVDTYDLMDFSNCWLQGFGATCGGDIKPPTPNPMTWETPPAPASSSSITMVAQVAVDDNLGYVEYQFERTVDGNFAGLTGWQTGRGFTDTGLLGDTQYCYRVRASDLCGNVTDWSQQACAIIVVDHNAPTPNPMAWESPPATASASSITMVAVTATDDSGGLVEYEFERTINGANGGSSGWQTNRAFTDTGLLGQTEYCYRVRAQDPFGNVTGWSPQACATITVDTNAPSPAPTIVFNPSIHVVTWDVCDLSGEFQFPYQYPDYDLTWWHRVVVNVAGIVDDSGGPVEIRFICNTHSSYNSNTRIPLAYRPILVGTAAQPTLGSKANGWRLTYNGDIIVYDVKTTQVAGSGVSETWTVCAYDTLMNSACSASHVIGP